jgi:hypothetical protein
MTEERLKLDGGRIELKWNALEPVYTPYHENLLATARQLIQEGRYQLAVVVSQMASEVLAEQVLDARIGKKNLGELEKWIDDRTPSSNLANETVLALFVALTGDRIQDRPFWPDYKAHVTLRNEIVHGGKQITQSDAENSLESVSKLLQHLVSVLQAGQTT